MDRWKIGYWLGKRNEHFDSPHVAERDSKVPPAWQACHDRRHVDHCWYHYQLLDQLRLVSRANRLPVSRVTY